jgi:GntR family transcriptional repressor for pyruvate dehydrogenase complex
MAIIEAGNNVILLHMMRAMYDLLAAGVFYNRQVIFARNTTRAELLRQHAAINDALQARDAQAARAAIEAHLDFISAALLDHIRAEANEQVARQRLDHDTGS